MNLIKTFLTPFIYFIIFIKLIFLGTVLSHAYFSSRIGEKSERKKTLDPLIVYWKQRTDFIFIVSMAILLLIIFYPRYDGLKYLNFEIKLLFFLFGIILLVTSNWGDFFDKNSNYKNLYLIFSTHLNPKDF